MTAKPGLLPQLPPPSVGAARVPPPRAGGSGVPRRGACAGGPRSIMRPRSTCVGARQPAAAPGSQAPLRSARDLRRCSDRGHDAPPAEPNLKQTRRARAPSPFGGDEFGRSGAGALAEEPGPGLRGGLGGCGGGALDFQSAALRERGRAGPGRFREVGPRTPEPRRNPTSGLLKLCCRRRGASGAGHGRRGLRLPREWTPEWLFPSPGLALCWSRAEGRRVPWPAQWSRGERGTNVEPVAEGGGLRVGLQRPPLARGWVPL